MKLQVNQNRQEQRVNIFEGNILSPKMLKQIIGGCEEEGIVKK